MDDPLELNRLGTRVSALARASSPAEILRALLEASAQGSPRAAILLVRHGRLRGWGSRGYPDDAAARLRGLDVEAEDRWTGRALADDPPEIVSRGPDERDPDFGQPPAQEAYALPVRVAGRTLALLLAESGRGEAPCVPPVLELLVTVARLRLELDLAWRKLGRPSTAQGRRLPREEPPRPSAAEPAGATEVHTPEVALEPARDSSSERHQEARTFARLVATDIRLYNEEAVMLGRQHRDLTQRLSEHLDRGRETFLRRYPDLGDEGLRLLREAYVQVLAAGDPTLLSPGT